MKGFIIKTEENKIIRFQYYLTDAPVTAQAFSKLLPFSRSFIHARVSGEEIWIDNAPELDIIQENASVFTKPGEVVLGPLYPKRTKTANCLGIYYGKGKGLDCANIFACVFDDDLQILKDLGEQIWKQGMRELWFEELV